MKRTTDAKRSKRPIPIPEEKDLEDLYDQRERLEGRIAHLDELQRAIDSPEWRTLVIECHKRLQQIERRAMCIDVKDTHAQASAVGQWNECLRIVHNLLGDNDKFTLTPTVYGVRESRNEHGRLLAGLLDRIAGLKKGLAQQGSDNNAA